MSSRTGRCAVELPSAWPNADVPEQVLAAVRLGRMVALRKPTRRIYGNRLWMTCSGACMVTRFPRNLPPGPAWVEHAGSLYKLFHTATALDACATVLSIDAVGAYDHVSRQAMPEGLRSRPAIAPLIPFARQFYGSASVSTWVDENTSEHDVTQSDGGEQVLLSAACRLERSRGGATSFAFLDDTYVVSGPENTGELHDAVEDTLWSRTRKRLNQGKTRMWSAASEEPAGLAILQPVGEAFWTGAWCLPADQQGAGAGCSARERGFRRATVAAPDRNLF
eukprot:s1891_g6.t1